MKNSPPVEWENLEIIFKEIVNVNNRDIGVHVERQRPIFENDGERKKGRIRISVKLFKDIRSLIISVPEAQKLLNLLSKSMEDARKAHDKCEKELKSWIDKKNQKMYRPGGNEGKSENIGKTLREKKKGKAGKAFHEQKKREKADKEKERRAGLNIKKSK